MKHRKSAKIKLDLFNKLFYVDRLSNAEIAKVFNVNISAIAPFRYRYNLPARGWGKGHPMQGKTHSLEARKKISKNRAGVTRGKDNCNWKGGTFLNIYGYKLVYVRHHPMAYRNYILEHRLIMSEYLGRNLTDSEIVHHKNGDKLDNRIENLEILSRSSHAHIHHLEKQFGIHKINCK